MNKWNFLASNGQLIKQLQGSEAYPVVTPRSQSFKNASVRMVGTVIYIYEDGNYATSIMFSQIGEIDGVEPTDLQDAYDKLIALIPTSGGGGGGGTQYNNINAYDEDATLPLVFDANSIHSFSIVAKTGSTTITVNGEETVIIEGQSASLTGSGLIAEEISIDSTTGEFLATTLS